jgi:hypothetical protein
LVERDNETHHPRIPLSTSSDGKLPVTNLYIKISGYYKEFMRQTPYYVAELLTIVGDASLLVHQRNLHMGQNCIHLHAYFSMHVSFEWDQY